MGTMNQRKKRARVAKLRKLLAELRQNNEESKGLLAKAKQFKTPLSPDERRAVEGLEDQVALAKWLLSP